MSFSYHLDLEFPRWNFENAVSQEWEGPLTWNQKGGSWKGIRLTLWLQTLTSPMTLTLEIEGKILKLLYLINGMVDPLGTTGMWVGYDVGCTLGLTLGHGAWQIDLQVNLKLFQFPTCWLMNGLFVHWSRGWGCCRSAMKISFIFQIMFIFLYARFVWQPLISNDDWYWQRIFG